MSIKKVTQRTVRRTFRVRNKYMSRGVKPRISVFRSNNNIYVQAIDDLTGKTLASYSSLSMKERSGDKSELAKKVGFEFGKLAKEKSINEVFFDRGRYRYHGRIAALADGLRESGVKF